MGESESRKRRAAWRRDIERKESRKEERTPEQNQLLSHEDNWNKPQMPQKFFTENGALAPFLAHFFCRYF